MFKKRNFNGITETTPGKLQLGAGAYFKNFTVGTDTYATAKSAGKCIGATQGGGEFSAVPTVTAVEVDGAGSRVKGLSDIDNWETYIKATLIEVSEDSVLMALGASKIDTTDTTTGYKKIIGKSSLEATDYIDNITWVGCLSGSNTPVIIQVHNCLNEGGLVLTTADKSQGKITLQAYGYNDVSDYESDEITPPFAIYYPTVAE